MDEVTDINERDVGVCVMNITSTNKTGGLIRNFSKRDHLYLRRSFGNKTNNRYSLRFLVSVIRLPLAAKGQKVAD